MQGIKEGRTRSGLYYEGYRILKAKLPKYSIIENVKNLTSKRFKREFDSILEDLSDLGYTNYWKVLNSKDYGIPQNRERVFIISIRNDIAQENFSFPPKVPLMWKLKDFLEDKVDEKYYLTEQGIGRLIKKNNKLIRKSNNPNVSACIIAGYHKMDGRNNQYIYVPTNIKRLGGLYDTENKTRQAGSIYNIDGISPTLTTMYGGNKQPFVLVKEGTKKGYAEAEVGDSINISYPKSLTKRGRVGKEISQTILTSPNMATLEKIDKPLNILHNKLSVQDRVYDTNRISNTIVSGNFRGNIAVLVSEDGKQYMRIRKLTPKECWRLMGFDDEDFYKAKCMGVSDTQLYRQAGNSIVVNVLEYIFRELLSHEIYNYESNLKCA